MVLYFMLFTNCLGVRVIPNEDFETHYSVTWAKERVKTGADGAVVLHLDRNTGWCPNPPCS